MDKQEGDDTKESLITYIYQYLPLGRYRYKIISNETDLNFLKQNQHYVGFNYYGFNNLLIFTKLNNSYYSFFIDRKTLSYSKDKISLKKVSIRQIKLEAHIDLYNGTIIDGIVNNQNGKITFVITDAYYVAGKPFMKIEYKTKLQQLKTDLINKIKVNKKTDQINIIVDEVYTYKDLLLPTLVDINNDILKPTNGINARGLIFYPRISGQKYIFTVNPKTKKPIQNKSPVLSESDEEVVTKNPIKTTNPYADMDPSVNKSNMLIKKTKLVDVYDMYLRETKKKFVKVGIAHIPNTKVSKLCKSFFESSDSDSSSSDSDSSSSDSNSSSSDSDSSSSDSDSSSSDSDSSSSDSSDNDSEDESKVTDIVVNCEWSKKFRKWIPIKKVKKETDFIDDIYDV
jgi:hypothetical protein